MQTETKGACPISLFLSDVNLRELLELHFNEFVPPSYAQNLFLSIVKSFFSAE